MAPTEFKTTDDPSNGTSDSISPFTEEAPSWPSDFSEVMTTGSSLQNQTDEMDTGPVGLWDDPMVRYFGITGILALLCILLLVVHIYISLLETKRERMADMKGNGPGMGTMAKGGGGGSGVANAGAGKKGFTVKFNR
eukprot:GHVO01059575.1.p1 GENE.GHVO01059575.1~~GHVO01059575.1.p1  ORF type:complete len:137 (+),score=13.66 GHVO01059575.1:125-535(+)